MIHFQLKLRNILIGCCALIVIPTINSQPDFFSIIYDSQKQYPIENNIESIHEWIYELQIGENKLADTLIVVDGEEHKYELKERNIHRYFGGDSIVITGYDGEGKLSFIGTKKYNADGTLSTETMDFKQAFMRPLSFSKSYNFLNEGRLQSVVNQECDTCQIQDHFSVFYDDEDIVEQVEIRKPEIGIVTFTRSQVEDTMRYTANYQLTDQYIRNLSRYGSRIDDLTKEYVDVYSDYEGNKVYKGIRINKKSGAPEVNWLNVRDEKNNVVKFSHFKEGKRLQTRSFEISDKGNVIAYTDIDSNGDSVTFKNDLTADGDYLIRRLKGGTLNFYYNDEGHWVKYTNNPTGVTYYKEIKIRKIKYIN